MARAEFCLGPRRAACAFQAGRRLLSPKLVPQLGFDTYFVAAVDVVFKAALQFYRARRGKGAKATDVSTFFKRKNLHVDFESFWQGSTNQRRGAFKRSWARYEKEFRE